MKYKVNYFVEEWEAGNIYETKDKTNTIFSNSIRDDYDGSSI